MNCFNGTKKDVQIQKSLTTCLIIVYKIYIVPITIGIFSHPPPSAAVEGRTALPF
jgi:hypothetical protein